MKRIATVGALLGIVVAAAPAAIIYQNDFESGLTKGFGGGVITAPNASTKLLGEFSADTTSLSLTGIGAHSFVTVDLDLFIIHSWDGSDPDFGPDTLRFSADTNPFLNATFSNTSPNQSYSDATPLGGGPFDAKTDADAIGALGYSDFFGTDTMYHLSFNIAHSASDLNLTFEGLGLQGVGDESWGIDNVSISANAVPEPATMAILGVGVTALLRRRRRA